MSHLVTLLDLIGSITTMAVIAINLVMATQALAGSRIRRVTIAAVAGGWVGLAMFLGASGRLAFSPALRLPLPGILLAAPLLTVGVLALSSKTVRATLLGLPLHLLIGVNVMRVVGVLFLLDFLAGTMKGPFPFFAGIGDMITGVVAIPFALRIARSDKLSARSIAAWNVFGVLDLIVAVGLGITSIAGSPLQLIHAGVGAQAIQYLPLCLVPTVLVPFYLLTHATIFAQLRARASDLEHQPGDALVVRVPDHNPPPAIAPAP